MRLGEGMEGQSSSYRNLLKYNKQPRCSPFTASAQPPDTQMRIFIKYPDSYCPDHVCYERRIEPLTAEQAREIVTLNVGGQVFTTTKKTLDKSQHIMTLGENQGQEAIYDRNGALFLDRPFRFFPIILDHMRGMDVSPQIKSLSTVDKNALLQEAAYYEVSGLLGNEEEEAPSNGLWLEVDATDTIESIKQSVQQRIFISARYIVLSAHGVELKNNALMPND